MKRQIEASETEQGAQSEAEARAKAADEKFVKLREVYQKLRAEHISLLRTNGETQKKLQSLVKEHEETEAERKVCCHCFACDAHVSDDIIVFV